MGSRQIDAIKVGIGADLGQLESDINSAKSKFDKLAAGHKVVVPVGAAPDKTLTALEARLQKLREQKIDVALSFNPGAAGIRQLRADVKSHFSGADKEVVVPITASMSASKVTKIRNDIQKLFDAQAPVQIRVVMGGVSMGTAPAPHGTPTQFVPSAVAAAAVESTLAKTPSRPARTGSSTPRQPRTGRGGARATTTTTTVPTAQAERLSPDNLRFGRSNRPEGMSDADYRLWMASQHDNEVNGPLVRAGQIEREQHGVRAGRMTGALRQANEPMDVPEGMSSIKWGARRGIARGNRQAAIGRDVQDERRAVSMAFRASDIGKAFRLGQFGALASGIPGDKERAAKLAALLGNASEAADYGDAEMGRGYLSEYEALATQGMTAKQKRKWAKVYKNPVAVDAKGRPTVTPEHLGVESAYRGLNYFFGSLTNDAIANKNSGRTVPAGARGHYTKAGRTPSTENASLGYASQSLINSVTGLEGTRDDTGRLVATGRHSIFDLLTGMAGDIGALEARRREGRAGGGPVTGGLLARLAAANGGRYRVNERGEEAYVTKTGKVALIRGGEQDFYPPEDGEIVPHNQVPRWLQRAATHGLAKDFTEHREKGGPVKKAVRLFNPIGGGFRAQLPGEADLVRSGMMSAGGLNGVQRVFVVNWPTGQGSVAMGGVAASSPLRPDDFKDMGAAFWAKAPKELREAVAGIRQPKAPAAPKEPPAGPKPRADAEEKALSSLAARGSAAEARQRLSEIRARTTSEQQMTPVRSFTIAVESIAENMLGGRGARTARVKASEEANRVAGVSISKLEAAETALGDRRAELAKADGKHKKAAEEAVAAAEKAVAARQKDVEVTSNLADAASRKITTPVDIARSIGVGAISLGVGGIAFQAGMTALQGVMDGAATAVGKVVERMTGFKNTSAEVTAALAQQVQAQHGATQAVMAASAASMGLSDKNAAEMSGTVGARAAGEAGNLGLEKIIDMLHTYQSIQGQNGASQFDQSLFRTTGGFFGTDVNGIPSTAELVNNELAAGGDFTDYNSRKQSQGVAFPAIEGQYVEQFDPEKFKALGQTIDTLNSQAKKGGSSLSMFVAATDEAGQAQVEATYKMAAADKDLKDISETWRKQGISFNGAESSYDIKTFLAAIQRSPNMPTAQSEIRQLTERIIPAQLAANAAQGRLERGFMNPGAAALGLISQPIMPYGSTFMAQGYGYGGGGRPTSGAAGANDSTRQQLSANAQAAAQLDAELHKIESDGRQAMRALVPPELKSDFDAVLAKVQSIGSAISNRQTAVAQRNATYQAAQYSEQLRISVRSLTDAQQLTGQLGRTAGDNLGLYERQSIALGRQSQILGFMLAQRQINFQLASAGFIQQGQTPEERQARMDEAKIEAGYAQKQLNLQRAMFGTQVRIVDTQNLRTAIDLTNQLNLLTTGRQNQLLDAADTEIIQRLQTNLALENAQAQTYINEGVKNAESAISTAAQIAVDTVDSSFTDILKQTSAAWQLFGSQAQDFLNVMTGAAPASKNNPGNYQDSRAPGFASGVLGSTNGAASITVGEAGRETVAVLRNPRAVMAPGYSAQPTQIIFDFRGTQVQSSDRSELVNAVLKALNTKSALLGMRRMTTVG